MQQCFVSPKSSTFNAHLLSLRVWMEMDTRTTVVWCLQEGGRAWGSGSPIGKVLSSLKC